MSQSGGQFAGRASKPHLRIAGSTVLEPFAEAERLHCRLLHSARDEFRSDWNDLIAGPYAVGLFRVYPDLQRRAEPGREFACSPTFMPERRQCGNGQTYTAPVL